MALTLLPLFLVSAAALALETALTRYFAVANWSDYGYWVISIVMAGFALSGVVLALARARLLRHADVLFAVLPAALVASAALGFEATIRNPFNPLQLQNQVTYGPQLGNIGLYYVALLPFFFLAGLFISLTFASHPRCTGLVYAADLGGAGAGCLLVLALMYLRPPFALIPDLLPLLALPALCVARHRLPASLGAAAMLAAGLLLLALGAPAAVSQYKPIYPPSHTPGAKILATVNAPAGQFLLLDDFTERVNTDISNDAAMLGYPDPPRSFGLYRDGIRIASLPRGPIVSGYAPGALDALPYRLAPHPAVLLVGASGGFRIAESLALGAASVVALEPDAVMYGALRHGLGGVPAYPADPRVQIRNEAPRAALAGRATYDLIDISADFMDAAPANVYAMSAEAFAADLRHVRSGGIVSIPVSIQDFPAYALRMLATAKAGLALDGIADPTGYVMVYRSAWNARILISPTPLTGAEIALALKWCDDRSFDVSYYRGMDVIAARNNLYNDLPAVSFDAGTVTAMGDDDSLADEAPGILAGAPTVSSRAFDLAPVTDDRPAFYAILRLDELPRLLARLQILPQAEIGALVNLAVLAQALLIALLVMVVPSWAPRRTGARPPPLWRRCVYFPALALGFLFLEIFAIEKASAYLADRATAFSTVLAAMLIFSGVGSFISGRMAPAPARAVRVAVLVIALWGLAVYTVLDTASLATAGMALPARIALVVLVMAPVSIAMGLPFPLGLGTQSETFDLAWAWALNGAVSVVATPLANLTLRNLGLHAVLAGAILMYVTAATSFPASRRVQVWSKFQKPSAVVD